MVTTKKNSIYRVIVFSLGLCLAGILCGCQNNQAGSSAGLYAKNRPLTSGEISAIQTCMMDCTQICQLNKETLQNTAVSLDKASQALQSGDTAAARKEVNDSLAAIRSTQKTIDRMIEKMPPANVCCPLSGKPIDIASVPPEKTRMHKGVKVGFGQNAEMEQWDKLTDAQKEEKIQKVIPDNTTSYLYMYTR